MKKTTERVIRFKKKQSLEIYNKKIKKKFNK